MKKIDIDINIYTCEFFFEMGLIWRERGREGLDRTLEKKGERRRLG
jgi:hypothetical protein